MLNVSPQSSPQPGPKGGSGGTGAGWAAWVLIGLAIAAVIALAVVNTTGIGTTQSTTAEPEVAATGDTVTVDVTVDGMRFVPDTVDVPVGSRLVVNFTNTGDMIHDLKIGDAESGRIDPGASTTFDAGVMTESVEGYCTIAGHKQQGMVFQVNVTGDASGEAGSTGGISGHEHMMSAGGSNPYVDVPDSATRTAARDGFTAIDPALAPVSGTVHEERWVMTEETLEVAPGVEQVRWTFNGQSPGPTLHGKVGDTFKITIVNEGTMGHSIDFHAGEVSPDENMKTINPGEELTYEFTANHAGAWMYHCSTAPMSLHIANGMAGAVVIDPADLDSVDAEYAMVADEIFLGDPAVGADADRVANGDFDLMAFNYYPNQYDLDPLEAKVGQTIRIWVVNVGPDQPLSFHVVGEQFDKVYKEGAYQLDSKPGEGGSQAIDLQPAQGGFVEMTFNEAGTYTFVNHIMTNAEKGQHGTIVVTK